MTLVDLIKDKGLSVAAVSQTTGISVFTIYTWSRGTRKPSRAFFAKLVEALNVPASEVRQALENPKLSGKPRLNKGEMDVRTEPGKGEDTGGGGDSEGAGLSAHADSSGPQ